MENNKAGQNKLKDPVLSYMKILTDIARESFLILDSDLRVVAANQVFYQNFKVSPEETENKILYDLGNGQWDIPELKKLLEEILPDKKEMKDYKVTHVFEKIGKKTILLNARKLDAQQLIILSMEDITAKQELELKLSKYAEELEIRANKLANQVKELEEFNKTMVGRELKMAELKKENEELKKDQE